MPFMMRFQGPPRAEALNHTPIHQVNNLLAELIDGKASCRTPSAGRLLTDKDLARQGDVL
jgi:hypothetical protein